MSYEWHDLVGNLGVICILLSYLLLQLDKLDLKSLSYSLINAVGAVLIIVSLIYNFNLSSMVIELVWLSISLFAIARYFVQRKDVSDQPNVQSNEGE